ncbi:MAG TPA: hypothetical protein P5164_13505 [Thermoanaerobaculia bacterium]|nr:hypothetical protein [Thermoanaerobaculia bacterium]
MRRLLPAAVAAIVLLAVGLANLDLLSGRATPSFRDLATTQRPARALAASLGDAALNPHASFGQTFRGNPNLVLAYPFPAAPRWLGVHLLLHAALGGFGFLLFLRLLGRSPEAALAGALAFSFSGFALSCTAFLNSATTLAWVPWLLASVAAARLPGRHALRLALLGSAASGALLAHAGEPALGLIGILLALAFALSGPRGTRLRASGALVGGGVFALLASAPYLLDVLRATETSARRLRGFSWTEFSAVGFHPLRLLETPFPFLFGDPSRVLSGAYWGYAASQGNPPYLASLSFGVLPLALAAAFALCPRRSEGRFWLGAAGLALFVAALPWVPGARAAYEALPFLHSVRYPVKALLVATIAVAVLAALAVERLLLEEALPRWRSRAGLVLLVLAGSFGLAAVAFRARPELPRGLLLSLWDPAWASDPGVVLAPVLARLPQQAASSAALLLVAGLLLARGLGDLRSRVLLLAALSAEGLAQARFHVPRAPAELYDRPAPLVAAAARIPGRVFERAWKDIDAVRRGLAGPLIADERLGFALAQTTQGWSLAGAPHGLRYAWDADPDGSYTLLDRYARDVVLSRAWPERLEWLRAAGVGAVIASDVPPGLAGLVPVYVEGRFGPPATLFRLAEPLPGVRRLSRVRGAASVDAAVAVVDAAEFDPATDGVVAGRPPAGTDAAEADPAASARVLAEGPDALVVETDGARPGLLLLDRSFTPAVRATANGRKTTVHAVQINLVGIAVPPGPSRVEVRLAP